MSPTALAILRAIARDTFRTDQIVGRRDGDFCPINVYFRPLEMIRHRRVLIAPIISRAVGA